MIDMDDGVGPAARLAAAAVQELERIRSAGVDYRLLRWCRWPGCWRSFNSITGPEQNDLGWIRADGYQCLLCPEHARAGHLPKTRVGGSPQLSLFVACECGASLELGGPASLDDCYQEWSAHVERVTADQSTVAVSEYTVCAYPFPDSRWWQHFALFVQHIGSDLWVVSDVRGSGPRGYLDVDGQWTCQPDPKDPDYEQWLARTRFTEQQALQLARAAAPTVVAGPGGLTIADAVAGSERLLEQASADEYPRLLALVKQTAATGGRRQWPPVMPLDAETRRLVTAIGAEAGLNVSWHNTGRESPSPYSMFARTVWELTVTPSAADAHPEQKGRSDAR